MYFMKKKQFIKFAVISGIFLTSTLVGIFYYVNEQLRREIEKAGEMSNATITRVFVNETWGEIYSLLPPPGSDIAEIKNNPNIKKIDNRMRRFMSYTDVLKVKLYNVSGITTYSSEFSQIGEDKSNNIGLQRALKGNLASELTYRGKFGAFDGELYNRNLVSTYAPIRDGSQVIAVAEIYSDRTTSIAQGLELRNDLIFLLITTLIVAYSIMLFITYRIYAVIKSEEVTSEHSSNTINENSGQSKQQLGHTSYENSYPFPHLSLFGVKEIIQYLALYGDLSFINKGKIKSDAFLADLSKKGKLVLNRMIKYRDLFQSPENFGKNEKVKINIDQLIKSISKYAESVVAIDSVQFYQGQKFSGDFIQSKDLIEAILTSYIDLVAYGYSKSKIEIKFYGNEKILDIDLIAGSSDPVDQSFHTVFHEFDQLMIKFANLYLLKYKATLSDKGLIVSISLNTFPNNLLQQSLKYSDAIVLGSSDTNALFYDGILKRIGFSSVHFGSYAELEQLTAINQQSGVVIIYEQTVKAFSDLGLFLDKLKNLGLNPKDIVFIVADEGLKCKLDDIYPVLMMPFFDEDLKRHFLNSP